jgi:hypothetical protein
MQIQPSSIVVPRDVSEYEITTVDVGAVLNIPTGLLQLVSEHKELVTIAGAPLWPYGTARSPH